MTNFNHISTEEFPSRKRSNYNATADFTKFTLTEDDMDWIGRELPDPDEISREENVNVSGNGNGTYRNTANSELNWYQSGAVSELKLCNTDTPPIKIGSLLETIFRYWPTNKEGHWLWLAQTYTARTLNWVLSTTIKNYQRGGIRKNPSAYFTYLLKRRKVRKEFRRINEKEKT